MGTGRQLGVAVALVQVRGSSLDQAETIEQREVGGTGDLFPGGTGKGKAGIWGGSGVLLEQPGRQALPALPFCGFPPTDGGEFSEQQRPFGGNTPYPSNPKPDSKPKPKAVQWDQAWDPNPPSSLTTHVYTPASLCRDWWRRFQILTLLANFPCLDEARSARQSQSMS